MNRLMTIATFSLDVDDAALPLSTDAGGPTTGHIAPQSRARSASRARN